MTVFKSRASKIIGTGLLGATLATGIYLGCKNFDKIYDKLIIEPAGKSVSKWLDSQYPIPELKYNE